MQFGNPHYEHIELVENSELLKVWSTRGIFEPLLNIPYPDMATSTAELLYLSSLSMDSDRLEYNILLDEHLFDMWREYLLSLGLSPSADIHQEIMVFEPIIDFLKLHYNRARPFQVAGSLGIPLYPRSKMASTDSSYPSGHTLFSLFIYHKYVQVAPSLKNHLMAMVLDVKRSREELGLHYPSDSLFSFRVYKHIKPYLTATPLHI